MIKSTIKTIIFLNLRFSDFYSKNFFKQIKNDPNIRLVAILDQEFKNCIGPHIAPYLDKIHFLHSNPKMDFLAEFDYQAIRPIVWQEVKQSQDVRIVCADEFNLLNAGKLRAEFGLQGKLENELLLFRDKLKMKEWLQKNHVRVPKFKKLKTTDHFQRLNKKFALPFVVKPIDGCGSHGVYIIHDEGDFNQFKNEIHHDQFIEVEEFIDGKLYHVDSWIMNNEIKFICANEYTCPNHDYTKGCVLASFPMDKHSVLHTRLVDFAKHCLQILSANNMVTHMELFLTKNNEIVFLEVSGRPPGAFLNLTHNINFGINLMDIDFCMQAGLNIPVNAQKSNDNAFFALFPLLPGKVINQLNPQVQSRYDMFWHVGTGDIIHKEECGNIAGKSAHAIFYNVDLQILRNDFERIKNHQAIEVI